MIIKLIATSTAGIEAVVKREAEHLGFSNITVQNGKVEFEGDFGSIARANLWFRSADRILIKIGEFKALTFDELFENTKALPWDEWICKNGRFTVQGKSVKSKLFSISDCQSIVKKAVVEKLKSKHFVEWFTEDGPDFTIQVALLNDIATLTLDSSGTGLHKRGYREKNVEAPIKETMASALIDISYWNKKRILLDPLCGSGTIPIEAALIGINSAPGLNRSFASEGWPIVPKKLWNSEREKARDLIEKNPNILIYGSDIDPKAIALAKENAQKAGVGKLIKFAVSDFKEVKPMGEYGVIISNPPYGERMGERQEAESLCHEMGKVFRQFESWSKYIITPVENFEKLYGKRADKKRKLFAGGLKVDYYQYFGPKPQRSI